MPALSCLNLFSSTDFKSSKVFLATYTPTLPIRSGSESYPTLVPPLTKIVAYRKAISQSVLLFVTAPVLKLNFTKSPFLSAGLYPFPVEGAYKFVTFFSLPNDTVFPVTGLLSLSPPPHEINENVKNHR